MIGAQAVRRLLEVVVDAVVRPMGCGGVAALSLGTVTGSSLDDVAIGAREQLSGFATDVSSTRAVVFLWWSLGYFLGGMALVALITALSRVFYEPSDVLRDDDSDDNGNEDRHEKSVREEYHAATVQGDLGAALACLSRGMRLPTDSWAAIVSGGSASPPPPWCRAIHVLLVFAIFPAAAGLPGGDVTLQCLATRLQVPLRVRATAALILAVLRPHLYQLYRWLDAALAVESQAADAPLRGLHDASLGTGELLGRALLRALVIVGDLGRWGTRDGFVYDQGVGEAWASAFVAAFCIVAVAALAALCVVRDR